MDYFILSLCTLIWYMCYEAGIKLFDLQDTYRFSNEFLFFSLCIIALIALSCAFCFIYTAIN